MGLERISTGIAGLDQATGGFLKGRSVLLTGRSGAGKTIMALQFANRCCSANKPVMYVVVRERREDLVEQAKQFDWPLERFESEGLLRILPLSETHTEPSFHNYSTEGGFNPLVDALEIGIEVAIIDNIGALAMEMSLMHFRQQLDYLLNTLHSRSITSLIVCDEGMVHRFGEVAEQAFDSIIRLGKKENQFVDKRERFLDITKMRFTAAPIDPLPFAIGKAGLELL